MTDTDIQEPEWLKEQYIPLEPSKERPPNGNGNGHSQVKQSNGNRKPRSKGFPKQAIPDTNADKKWWYIPLPSDIDLLKFDSDDSGNAEAMHAISKDQLIFCPALGWMEYTGSHWRVISESEASKVAIAALKMRQHAAVEAQNDRVLKAAIPSKRHISDCLWLYKALATVGDVNEFDSDPDLLNCQNGVVNLRTGSLTPHYPCQRFTYVLPVDYKPDADASLWVTFIHETVGETVAHFLQKATGYTFTGHTREEKLFHVSGPPRAGKGTFSETLLALLPHPFGAGVDFNQFTAKREADTQNFDLAPLRPSRFVVASESNRFQSLNPAKIKTLTGGDNLYCAFKHKDHFSYRPQFKVWLLSNHPVNADADDDALWARVIAIVFPNSRVGKEDMGLKARLKSVESLEGLLRWIVDGAKLWYAEGLGILPESIQAATKSQRDLQDYTKQWIGECCELGRDYWTSSADIVKSYKKWCEEANVKPVSPSQLMGTLTQRFGCVAVRKGHDSKRGYSGIRLQQPLFMGKTADIADTADSADTKNRQKNDCEVLHEKNPESGVGTVGMSASTPKDRQPLTPEQKPMEPTLTQGNSVGSADSADSKNTDIQGEKTVQNAVIQSEKGEKTVQNAVIQSEIPIKIPRCQHMRCIIGPKMTKLMPPSMGGGFYCPVHRGYIDASGRPL